MKPADRALDIVVVGLGQAGGNLAAEFARLGYRALALNTAHTDLSSLAGDRQSSLAPEQRVYIGIDGYDGAGADMNYGKECVQENAERIRNTVSNHAEGADVLIVTAGLGGGTGSSVSELVRTLTPIGVPMIVLATLPNEYESGIAKVNAVRAVSDLVKQTNIGWIFADNHRLSQLYGGVSLDKYFEKVNSVIIQPLDAFNRLNDRKGIHPIRTLDGEDFRALLMSNGVINYSETSLSALTVDAVCDRVRETLANSAMMPAGFSAEEVSYMGVVLEASEDVLRGTPFSFYEQLNEQLKHDTGGAAIYMGVYRTDRPVDGGAAMLRVIASTQSLPAGVQAMVNDARREGGTLRDKLQRSMSALDLGEIEDFDLFKTTLRTGNTQNRSRRPAPPQLSVPEVPVRRGGRAPHDGATRSAAGEHAPADADPDPAPAAPSLIPPAFLAAARGDAQPAEPPGAAPSAVAVVHAGEESRVVHAGEESRVDGALTGSAELAERLGIAAGEQPIQHESTPPGAQPLAVPSFEDVTSVDAHAAANALGAAQEQPASETGSFAGVALSEEVTTSGSDPTAASLLEGTELQDADLEVSDVDASDLVESDVEAVEATAVRAYALEALAPESAGVALQELDRGADSEPTPVNMEPPALLEDAEALADETLETTDVGFVDAELVPLEEELVADELIDDEVTDIERDSSALGSPSALDSAVQPAPSALAAPSPAPALSFPDNSERGIEADGYNKLVSTFLRTEFDSTRRRVARRLDAARKSEDEITRALAERALERVREAGQLASFEEALRDGPSALV